MSQGPATLVVMLVVWVISLTAGVLFIQQAFHEKKPGGSSRLNNAVNEIRFRIRLAMGLGLVIWVIGGVVWVLMNWN